MGGEAGRYGDFPERRDLRYWDVTLTRMVHVYVADGFPSVRTVDLQENETVLGFLHYLATSHFRDPTTMARTVVLVVPFGLIEEERHQQPPCERLATKERRQLGLLPT